VREAHVGALNRGDAGAFAASPKKTPAQRGSDGPMTERRGRELELYALHRDEGQAIWFLDTLTLVKATGAQTGGAYGLVEQVLPAGSGSPYHVHHAEDETFYILEGEASFISEGRLVKAAAGSSIFLPRDIPHGFRVDRPSRLLILTTPAGFEQFLIEAGQPARELALPPAEPPDLQRLVAVAAKYHIDILGPLPEIGEG
jgi:quercetin dioxygenase-like cupin family protein